MQPDPAFTRHCRQNAGFYDTPRHPRETHQGLLLEEDEVEHDPTFARDDWDSLQAHYTSRNEGSRMKRNLLSL